MALLMEQIREMMLPTKKEEKVAGRLQWRKFRAAWKEIGLGKKGREILKRGVRVPWKAAPKERERRQKIFQGEKKKEVEKYMKEMVEMRVIERSREERGQHVGTLEWPEGADRLVYWPKEVNEATRELPARMSSVGQLREMVEEGDYIWTWDFTKFYWSCQIAKEHRRFFKFRWGGRLYQFRVIPFGWKGAMAIMKIFTDAIAAKVMRENAVKIDMWVDDGTIIGKEKKEVEKAAREVIRLAEAVGFMISKEKTMKEAKRKVKVRGFILDTKKYKILVPQRKIRDIRKAARKIKEKVKEKGKIKIKEMASLLGKIKYVGQASRVARMKMGEMQRWLNKAVRERGWRAEKEMKDRGKVWKEIKQWEKIKYLTGDRIQQKAPTKICFTDGGPTGSGAHDGNTEIAWKHNKKEMRESQNAHELRALLKWMKLMKEEYKEETIEWRTDSVTAASYIRKTGGRVKKLMRIAMEIIGILIEIGADIIPKVVDQEEIAKADELSRRWDKKGHWIELKKRGLRYVAPEPRKIAKEIADQMEGRNERVPILMPEWRKKQWHIQARKNAVKQWIVPAWRVRGGKNYKWNYRIVILRKKEG